MQKTQLTPTAAQPAARTDTQDVRPAPALDGSPRLDAQQSLQAMVDTSPRMVAMGVQLASRQPPQSKPGGLPDKLKSGIESLSGMSMDHVKVHHNSSQPKQLNAHAYAQGSDIHLAPGQERHLPHEAWHVVQQAQGRVKPTMQLKRGVPVNNEEHLEREADVMGARAAQMKQNPARQAESCAQPSGAVVQKVDRVINYGSGTSPETLMKAQNEHALDIDVTNIDSGHMLLADVIQKYLAADQAELLGNVVGSLLLAYNASYQRNDATIKDLVAAASNGDMAWMKHHYFTGVNGYAGVIEEVNLMSPEAQGVFAKSAEKLGAAFALGDATTALPRDGKADTIYCINGYGYSPLTDPDIFNPMSAALKKGGNLIIMSELMGPTAKPFLGFARGDRATLSGLFYLTRAENVITENPDPTATMNISRKEYVTHQLRDNAPLTAAFEKVGKERVKVQALTVFDWDHKASTIYVSKSTALGHDPLTSDMESRHTEGGSELDENMHVRLVFTRK
jgi:hypothetical protein